MACAGWDAGGAVLELQALTVRAGGFELGPVDLTVGEGECHVILGPTGGGKTVLLEGVLGLRAVAAGKVILGGEDIGGQAVESRRIGYVPQDLALFPHLSVRGNIEYGLRVRRIRDRERGRLIEELAETVGITGLMGRSPGNLSGGERQRVALVRALASGCRMLLLDEPFSALNESLRKDLWLMIKDLQRRYRLTLLMITHDLEEAFFLGDRLSVLIDGRVCQSAAKRTVYQHPATLEVAQFFGIKNLYRGRLEAITGGRARVVCARLGTTVEVCAQGLPSGVGQGAELVVGIRATEVMVRREGIPHPPRENLLRGRIVALHDKGAAYTVLFLPEGAQDRVEIELNTHAYRRLGLAEGGVRTVSLKQENLFVVRGAERLR